MEIDGKEYLLELPLKADVALLLGHTVDKAGNIVYYGATRNFNTLMATAADTVIVEAENLVEVGGNRSKPCCYSWIIYRLYCCWR